MLSSSHSPTPPRFRPLTSTRVSFTSVKAGDVLESGTKDIKEDDVVIYKLASGIAKSDYVIATAHNEFTEEGMQTIYDVTKATEIDGAKLTKISGGDFYFDGTVYTKAGEATLSGDDDYEAVGKVGNKYDLVLNANGDIVFLLQGRFRCLQGQVGSGHGSRHLHQACRRRTRL